MDHHAFTARQTRITLDGLAWRPVEIAYTDLGDGPPMILLHGIPTWSYLYHDVIDTLAATNRVIAPDFIGHGRSDMRDGLDRSLVAQRAMVVALMDALGLERTSLVGHDTGGGVALMMGIENADRVEKLILSNIVAYDSWPIDDMIQVGHPGWAAKSNAEIATFLEGGFRDGLSRPDRLTPAFVEGIVAPYVTDTGRVSLIRNASSLNTNHTTMLVDRHRMIAAPTLMVWGEDDPWQPVRDGERLAAEIPGARLERVARASHWIPQDAPKDWLVHVQPFLSA